MLGSELSWSTRRSSSASDVSTASRTFTLSMPASSAAFVFELVYTTLAGSSPTSTTASPGLTPFVDSFLARAAASSRTVFAMARPSISSAGKVHCSRLPDQHDLDLARILELGLDAARNLFGERRHSRVVHFFGSDDDAHFTAGLDGEDLLDAAIARRDLLETLETLHVRFKRFASGARSRTRDRVRGLDEYRDFGLVGNVV